MSRIKVKTIFINLSTNDIHEYFHRCVYSSAKETKMQRYWCAVRRGAAGAAGAGRAGGARAGRRASGAARARRRPAARRRATRRAPSRAPPACATT